MIEISLLIAVVVALTQIVKMLEVVSKKYLPLVSLVLGIAAGIFYVPGELKEQVLYGVMIGLAASGLFDQSKIIKRSGE